MLKLETFNEILNHQNEEETCEIETTFEPMIDEKTEEVVAVIQVETCKKCNEKYVVQMFTNGALKLEILADDLGFREDIYEDLEDLEDEE